MQRCLAGAGSGENNLEAGAGQKNDCFSTLLFYCKFCLQSAKLRQGKTMFFKFSFKNEYNILHFPLQMSGFLASKIEICFM